MRLEVMRLAVSLAKKHIKNMEADKGTDDYKQACALVMDYTGKTIDEVYEDLTNFDEYLENSELEGSCFTTTLYPKNYTP